MDEPLILGRMEEDAKREIESGTKKLEKVRVLRLALAHPAIQELALNHIQTLEELKAVTTRHDGLSALLDELRNARLMFFESDADIKKYSAILAGHEGGRVANLAGDDKAIVIANRVRKERPGISDRELAAEVKRRAGASVSVQESSLRRKLSNWSKAGVIPPSNAKPGRLKKGKRRKGG